ncbi:MAG: ABC transporter ATP-binding protein [Clostridiales bacterium]|nr:ABC transporter ATP-binding protein [Clostridiales bacterium]
MLEVQDLSVRYGENQVVCGASFTVQSGEWLMITGPNGAGKSSMLSALMQGVPYTGGIRFEGENLQSMKPRRRALCMGLLAQRYASGYAFTVEEIVRLGRYAYHDALSGFDAADENAVAQALHETGTYELRSHPVSRISGGELQRAFLAQLFAQNPKLLLLDEPSSHLDLAYQKQILTLISGWLRQGGRAVISVMHDLAVARRFGTRVMLLHRGHIEADGAPEQALSPSLLSRVYGMDVEAWMQGLYGVWSD